MSYINYLPKPLLGDIINNQCIPIIGAGFSLNAVVSRGGKMPLWEDLGKKFASELLEYPYNNPVDAISAYCHEYSKIKLIEKLTEYIHIMDSKPGDVHTAFCSIPFDIVCTTNFDFLLERGYEKTGMYCLPIIEESQLPISNRKYDLISEVPKISLLKLHGDLNHPERIVVTEQDYDSFLDKYPLISTYLANLLITRTPIFIGYSLDDPDFRQVWQIINERLGKLCRPAYALVVNSDRATISKFDRRNVKVINIPGKGYQQVLVKLFKEIREYWIKSQDVNKTLQDQTLAELSLPVESVGRLCYFMIASKYQSFYKSYVYPIAKDYGITPISFDEAISAGDNNILAREIALIERADLIIIDIDNERQLESLQIAMEKRKKQVYLLVVHEGGVLFKIYREYQKYSKTKRFI
ncbi:MAG: SIR2 family protein [Firmicutes bacterium]|nr:SIR2 family protein [Bacillota bacterium]